MPENDDIVKESTSLVEEIEKQLERIVAKKHEEVKKQLEEKIKREEEEANKKMRCIEEELNDEKKSLEDYKTSIADFENNKARLKNGIKNHVNKAFHYQTEIEKLAGATLNELREVRELNEKIGEIRQEAAKRTALLKKELEEKFGIVAEVPNATEGEEDVKLDLEHELSKLRKIKEILGASETLKPLEIEGEPEEVEREEEVSKMKKTSKISEEAVEELEIPEIKDVMDISPPEEEKFKEEEPENDRMEEKEEEKVQKKEKETKISPETLVAPETTNIHLHELDKEEMLNILENFRKTESTEGNGKISYFQKNNKIVLDGGKIISTIKNCLERAKKNYQEMSQKESPKDQFFLKQEIINNQEFLRKLILRGIKKCEKESCSLPKYTADIINIQNLKDILEKLSIQNWSNEDEFKSFNKYFEALRKTFLAKITPPDAYIRSIIKQLE